MIKIYKIIKTNELIAIDLETNEVLKMVEVNSESEKPPIGGGISEKPSKPVKTKTVKIKRIVKAKKPVAKIKKSIEDSRVCTECGKEVPKGKYLCRGLCGTCYQRNLYRKKAKQKSESKKKKSDILNYDPEKTSAVNSYSCDDCYHDFKSVFDLIDTKCPECGSVHVKQV